MKKFYDTKNKNVILALLAVLLISLGVLASQNIKEGLENEKKKDQFDPKKITDFMNGVADQPNAIIDGFKLFTNVKKN